MARNDEFDVAGGPTVAIKELLGELVLFTPTEYIEEMTTQFGDKDAVMTDMVVLSQDGQPAYEDVLIFQGAIIGSLKKKIAGNRKMLGRIGQGEAKRGQSAPFILTAPSDEDQQMARDYLAGRTVAAAVAPEADDPFAVKA